MEVKVSICLWANSQPYLKRLKKIKNKNNKTTLRRPREDRSAIPHQAYSRSVRALQTWLFLFFFLTAHSSLASSRLRRNSFYSSENNTRDALQPTPLPTIHRKVRLNDQKSQAERHLKPLRWCGRPRISCHIFEGNTSSHRLCGSLTYTTRRPMNKARYVLAKLTWFAERTAKKIVHESLFALMRSD